MVQWSPLMIYTAIKIALYKIFCGWLKPKPIVWYEARVLCLGLDGAGKTSVLQRAADRTASAPVAPTTGFIVKTLTLPPDWKVDVWDIGGAAPVRPYWTKYVTADTRALIWVLDASDRARLEEASSALRSLLASEVQLQRRPLLVLLNKADLGGGAAVTMDEAAAALGLAQQKAAGSPHHVQACSAETGQGVSEGLEWLSSTLTATFR